MNISIFFFLFFFGWGAVIGERLCFVVGKMRNEKNGNWPFFFSSSISCCMAFINDTINGFFFKMFWEILFSSKPNWCKILLKEDIKTLWLCFCLIWNWHVLGVSNKDIIHLNPFSLNYGTVRNVTMKKELEARIDVSLLCNIWALNCNI